MEPVRELHFMLSYNKNPRLTVTPSRAVLKFLDTTDEVGMERLTKFSHYIIAKLGNIQQSYRSKIETQDNGKYRVCMSTDSNKDRHYINEPDSYED